MRVQSTNKNLNIKDFDKSFTFYNEANKIYRKIEDCKTWESILHTINMNLKPFENNFQNQILHEYHN